MRAALAGMTVVVGCLTGAAGPPPPLDTSNSQWTYEQQHDEMRGTTASFAATESVNQIDFGFPYHVGKATLRVRQRTQDGLSIMLAISGQFVCHSYSGEQISVKFDAGKVVSYPCSEPADGASGLLFISNEASFLQELKKAKRTIIETEFYEAGPRQMIFDTHGLVWPPKDAAVGE